VRKAAARSPAKRKKRCCDLRGRRRVAATGLLHEEEGGMELITARELQRVEERRVKHDGQTLIKSNEIARSVPRELV